MTQAVVVLIALAFAAGMGLTGFGAMWLASAGTQDGERQPLVIAPGGRPPLDGETSFGRHARTSSARPTPVKPLAKAAATPKLQPPPATSTSASDHAESPSPTATGAGTRSPNVAAPTGDAGDSTPPSVSTPQRPHSEDIKADQVSQARKLEAKLVELTNEVRTEHGCEPLRVDARLHRAALAHSEDMARRGYFSHTSPDGTSPWDRARAEGYDESAGENLARGHESARAVMDALMEEEEHRRNILNCESEAIGVGVDMGGQQGPYWTQLFGYE